MAIHSITPKDRADWLARRAEDITSTDVAALFDCSPYCTAFELWHRKKDGTIVELEPSDRMRWGVRLQDSIAHGIAEDQGWTIRRMDEYMRDDELMIGASFDFAIGDDGLLEIKNVDSLQFKDGWIVDGDSIEAPAHIELQLQHQLAVSGRAFAYIGALVGGNRVVLIKREPDAKIIAAIKSKVKAFWQSIADNKPPTPNFERDAEMISKLYGYAEVGKVKTADEEIEALAAKYREAGQAEKAAQGLKEAAKAELLMLIGDAEKVKGATFSISAGMIGPKHVEYDRDGYRDFRLHWKRSKGDK